ncbi:MAG: DNA polymerase III subunit delta' [Rhizobiales bacterium]|nr:DNA polymerase III subunit delta' [Hyphomicrobiales bacterium]
MARAARSEEERGAADAIPGVAPPRETTTLVGQEAAERTLLDAYRSGRMHHGWIFAGERGIGKATLAFRLARYVFVNPDPDAAEVRAAGDLSVPPEHPAARRLAVGVHANLLPQQREWDDKSKRFKSELSIDSVRRITRFLGTTAGEGGWRVVIIDPADDMSLSAANAILKNLEEPPRRTLFILIARSRGALLPTILSRCRGLDLWPLSVADTEAVVRNVASGVAKPSEQKLSAALAGGSPRRLIEIVQNDGAALYRLLLEAIERGDPRAQLKISSMAMDAASTEQFLELYRGYLARRVRGLPEPSPEAKPPAAPLVTWAELWDKATLSGRDVETYNLDRRQFVLETLEATTTALGQPGHLDNR